MNTRQIKNDNSEIETLGRAKLVFVERGHRFVWYKATFNQYEAGLKAFEDIEKLETLIEHYV